MCRCCVSSGLLMLLVWAVCFDVHCQNVLGFEVSLPRKQAPPTATIPSMIASCFVSGKVVGRASMSKFRTRSVLDNGKSPESFHSHVHGRSWRGNAQAADMCSRRLQATTGHVGQGRNWRQRSRYYADVRSLEASVNSIDSSVASLACMLQDIYDEIAEGGDLRGVENTLREVEGSMFAQADAWGKTWVPTRSIIAQVPESFAISVLSLPRGTVLEWQRHDRADSVSSLLFGNVKITSLELQSSDTARKLEQQELEKAHADAWAVGGSDESDCVCRGGRCPRMWDCPFWVDRRRAEAKGSSAHVARKTTNEEPNGNLWRAGPMTVRRVETLEPSALLEVHVGQRHNRFYQEIASTAENAVELIETLAPVGVKPGVGRYTGPSPHLPETTA